MTNTSNITTQALLAAKAHFGHISSRWNPKMSRFIIMKKNDLHIIDLDTTLKCLTHACTYMKTLALNGKKIMFVGTKEQARNVILTEATKLTMPYVSDRWLGGTLTNFNQIRKLIKKWQSYEKTISSTNYQSLTKKEQLTILREKDKLSTLLGGLVDVSRLPSALFVVDIKKEHIAVREANSLGIPVIGIVDTNVDPDLVDYPIPANDDSVDSIEFIVRAVADTIKEGLHERTLLKQKDNPENESAANTKNEPKNPQGKENPDHKKQNKENLNKPIRITTGANKVVSPTRLNSEPNQKLEKQSQEIPLKSTKTIENNKNYKSETKVEEPKIIKKNSTKTKTSSTDPATKVNAAPNTSKSTVKNATNPKQNLDNKPGNLDT